MGDDLNQWVCKYNDLNKLFNELLASEFAKLWHINIPECALVEIDYDRHIVPFGDKKGLERRFFERECFGSRFLNNALDVNQSVFVDKNIVRRIKNKENFLKIALFDIWLANEDRNAGNYNLLLQSVKGGYILLYIIDNTDIFNSSMAYTQGIVEITEDDSVLKSDLATLLFKNMDYQFFTESVLSEMRFGNEEVESDRINSLLEDFPIFVKECKDRLPYILAQLPKKWCIDVDNYQNKINDIFLDNWLRICEQLFRTYIQTFIICKP